MAKGKNKVTVEVNATQVPGKPTSVDPWQVREDVGDLIRSSVLRKDKTRYGRAVDAMRDALGSEGKGSSRLKAKRGRRTVSRNIGKR